MRENVLDLFKKIIIIPEYSFLSTSKLPESENPKVFTPGEISDASIAYVSNKINMKERKRYNRGNLH